ncbi:MAG: hypothetical protein COY66_00490 [Candidatus Kerfeldbacteria bacterium CG_4_10_14_0_8_um_filter_42_10]|uniref:UDP-N-acetylmuramoyl-tripeptide--D-alanyl-D-alanine ligase n=1 Tax=Candidatus Kerfeldbacteria bacterium CG_4_10_14_0_8_um_filter_42_10 TaxID=2014248 RepID=A0A2M7RKH3_9BACT|nr:MAG: hypothetical protein COY66_00490 [Candidatus Kerfeldbacteria bacterium CG_4_10_14_0_8_um_filter_42_10]
MNFFRKILEKKLRILARAILKKYHPDIIGITGSVGKTSTKEAIYTVLKSKFTVRKNIKNYNNEIGVPLTIIGSESGNKSIFSWMLIFLKAAGLILFKDGRYPKILVIEMGADRPGDIAYLVKMAPCKIGVITAIGSAGPVHLEFFGKVENVVKEKSEIIRHLAPEGFALLNHDDQYVHPLKEKTKAKVISFGFSKEADIWASELVVSERLKMENSQPISGISFKINYGGNMVPIFLPGVLGRHQAYAALAAAAVGVIYNFNLVEVAESLKEFKSPPGRMNLIPGIKNTMIIDDSYNSSPVAALAALQVLASINLAGAHNKYAVLGDMSELGSYTEKGHAEVGQYVARAADVLITVGEKGKMIAEAARQHSMLSDRVFEFADSQEAGLFLQERIEEGDLILVKGSQSVRMEKIVKELMAEPLKAKQLLVRQDEAWQNK